MLFNTPQVRDLAWVIQSPDLLKTDYRSSPHDLVEADVVIDDSWCEQQFSKHKPWLQALDDAPGAFLQWLQARQSPRLGYYFESLVEYWLSHDSAISRLVSHLQVNEKQNDEKQAADIQTKKRQRTVGEFDFLLVYGQLQSIQHWEVAVKFYLHHRHEDGRIQWYGPNPRDRLDIKLHRLFHHQLTLSRLPAANIALRHLGLVLPLKPRLLLKGYLFYRSDSDWRQFKPDYPGISAQHLRGWWTFMEPFNIPNTASDSRWMYLPRLHWLAPAKLTADNENKLMNYRKLHGFCLDICKRHGKPPLLAEMRFTQAGYWEEVSRGFVVPQHWPGIAAKP